MADCETGPQVSRRSGLSRPTWFLVAGFCVFVEFAGWSAANGHINGWQDIVFIISFAALGLAALFNALRRVRQAR